MPCHVPEAGLGAVPCYVPVAGLGAGTCPSGKPRCNVMCQWQVSVPCHVTVAGLGAMSRWRAMISYDCDN